jgi:hypothetical protein
MYDKPNSTYKNCTIYRSNRIRDLYPHSAAPITDLSVRMEEGIAFLQFSADPYRTYIVEASSDLTHWTEQGPAELDDDGLASFADSDSQDAANRYYRILTP